jgi:hypothetical protein
VTPIESVGARVAQGIGLGMIQDAHKIGIVGSRKYPQLARVEKLVDHLRVDAIVISGGAAGVDSYACGSAARRGLMAVNIAPDSRCQGEPWVGAALERNGLIALCADVVIAFWDGKSKGTKDTISKALKMGCCIVVLPDAEPQVWEPVP